MNTLIGTHKYIHNDQNRLIHNKFKLLIFLTVHIHMQITLNNQKSW